MPKRHLYVVGIFGFGRLRKDSYFAWYSFREKSCSRQRWQLGGDFKGRTSSEKETMEAYVCESRRIECLSHFFLLRDCLKLCRDGIRGNSPRKVKFALEVDYRMGVICRCSGLILCVLPFSFVLVSFRCLIVCFVFISLT